jgi:hypothetical protein
MFGKPWQSNLPSVHSDVCSRQLSEIKMYMYIKSKVCDGVLLK